MSDIVIRAAASRIGIPPECYAARLALGLKWCTACGDWHHRDAFGKDASRGDGLHAECARSRRVVRRTPAERFAAKIGSATQSGCVEWGGSTYPSGYGSFWFDGRVQAAHRVAWVMSFGPIPDGLYVLHRCDNPPCVNPTHLFLGTHKENMEDMDRKGRRGVVAGEANPRAKVTAEDVAEIRGLGRTVSQRLLALRFGVTKTAVRKIQKGQNWKSVREFPAPAEDRP